MAGPHAGNRNRPAYSGQQRFRFPKQIIKLFAPRKPIEFKPPIRKHKLRPMTGVASFLSKFETKDEQTKRIEQVAAKGSEPPFETPAKRRRRVRREKVENFTKVLGEQRRLWDPFKEENRDGVKKTEDAFKTLFVANIPYETVEQRLRDEFEHFGPVKEIVMPKDLQGFPKGYGFVEFERERDLKAAYRGANGIKVDGRRLLVDVERGRTVEDWKPNRLDGPHNGCARKQRWAGKEGRPVGKA